MVRETGSDSRRLSLIFVILFLFAATFPGLTLFSGQVIKQFETYSLAQSMANVGWNPFATTIPCDGGIRWVLELPIFAGIGGVFVALFPGWPSVFPVLVYGLFLFGLVRLRSKLAPESGIFYWVAVAATPVFLRFSAQFLADPFAVALLLLGAGFFLGRRSGVAFLFFLLAVSVKPTVLPSILFFRWAFEPTRNPRSLFPTSLWAWLQRETFLGFLLVVPFLAWSLSVRALGIPSPMHEGGILAIGNDWGILTERAFYSKFFVWTVFKGVGIPLFFFAVLGVLKPSERVHRLAAWSIGIVPYWFLVRRLNVIHDYYSLSFFLPIAILGALAASEIATKSARNYVLVRIALGIGIAQGLLLFALQARDLPFHSPVSERPVFCGKEMRSESLMGLPKVSD